VILNDNQTHKLVLISVLCETA